MTMVDRQPLTVYGYPGSAPQLPCLAHPGRKRIGVATVSWCGEEVPACDDCALALAEHGWWIAGDAGHPRPLIEVATSCDDLGSCAMCAAPTRLTEHSTGLPACGARCADQLAAEHVDGGDLVAAVARWEGTTVSDAETTRDAAHQDREIGLESLGVALVRSVGGPFADLALDLARDDRPGQEPGERRGVERGVHGCVTYDADHCPGCAAAATRDGHDRADVEREP